MNPEGFAREAYLPKEILHGGFDRVVKASAYGPGAVCGLGSIPAPAVKSIRGEGATTGSQAPDPGSPVSIAAPSNGAPRGISSFLSNGSSPGGGTVQVPLHSNRTGGVATLVLRNDQSRGIVRCPSPIFCIWRFLCDMVLLLCLAGDALTLGVEPGGFRSRGLPSQRDIAWRV